MDHLAEVLPRSHVLDILGLCKSTFYKQQAREQLRAALAEAPQQDVPLSSLAATAPASAAGEGFTSEATAQALVPPRVAPKAPRPPHFRSLSEEERRQVLEVLDSARFIDSSPRVVWATLLEEDIVLCHWRTMYRLLAERGPVQDRRPQRTHPRRAAPDLSASAPMEVWCWDITLLPGPVKGSFFYLYTVLDIYSRYIVGWRLESVERGELAAELFQTLCERWEVGMGTLVLHADRGGPMRSQPLGDLLERLGVTRSHSRPRVSDDNPFIEAHFKTMKYSCGWPGRFDGLEEAKTWVRAFVEHYNAEHRHSGLGLLTPAQVHSGQAAQLQAQRQETLHRAALAHPERYVHGARLPRLPSVVRIGKPQTTSSTTTHNPDEATTDDTFSTLETSTFH